MSEEEFETITSITTEKRKTNFNIRYVTEVEISPSVWIKINNGNPMKSKSMYTFDIQDEETQRLKKDKD